MLFHILTTCSCLIAAFSENVLETSNCQGQKITNYSVVDIKDLSTPLDSGGPSCIPTQYFLIVNFSVSSCCLPFFDI